MPQLYLSNPGIFESVTRPVIMEVTRQLFEATGLPKDTSIIWPGDTGRAKQPGSTIQGSVSDGNNTTFGFGNKMYAEVDEQDDPDRIFSIAVMRTENRAIFIDHRLETALTPVYSPQEVTISFRHQSRDKASAERWRNDIRARLGNEMDTQRLHRFSYSWMLPEEYMVILQEIYRLMRENEPYENTETFEKWFSACASSRVTEATTFAGTEAKKVVAETQMRVVGYFDFDTLPEKGEREGDSDAWLVAFSYKFRYEKPTGCVMAYPLMIHNQLIKYRPAKMEEQVDAHLRSYSNSGAALRNFEKGNTLLGVDAGVSIPSFDEFFPSSVVSSTTRIFTALTSVDPAAANPRNLLNLAELGEVRLHSRIMRFIRDSEWSWMTRPYLSVFNVSLYRNAHLLPYQKVSLSAALNVAATYDLSLRNYYHVRTSFVDDFSLLSAEAQERLRNNADVVMLILLQMGLQHMFPKVLGCNLTIQDILEALALDDDDPKDFCTNYITREEWNKLITLMNGYIGARDGVNAIRQFNTVMTLSITAYKESDLADR